MANATIKRNRMVTPCEFAIEAYLRHSHASKKASYSGPIFMDDTERVVLSHEPITKLVLNECSWCWVSRVRVLFWRFVLTSVRGANSSARVRKKNILSHCRLLITDVFKWVVLSVAEH